MFRDISSSAHIKVLPYSFSEGSKTSQQDYLVCGEQRTFTIVIELPEGVDAGDIYQHLYGRLEGYTVNEGSSVGRGGMDCGKLSSQLLRRMRSVESMTTVDSSDSCNDPKTEKLRQWPAHPHDGRIISIPIPVLVDSDRELTTGASVLLRFSLLETIQDASLARFFAGQRSGVRLLRKLLSEREERTEPTGPIPVGETLCPASDPVHKALSSSLEIVKEIELKLPLCRPLQALLTVHKISPEITLIGVMLNHLAGDGDASHDKECTILDMQLSVGGGSDPYPAALFRTRPYALNHLPARLLLGGSFGAVFETTLVPFAERGTANNFRTDEIVVSLMAHVRIQNEFVVRFESELDLSRMFPAEVSDQLTVGLTVCDPDRILLNEPFDVKVFINNGSSSEHDLILSLPIENSMDKDTPSRSQSLTIRENGQALGEVSPQGQVMRAYAEYDMMAPAFVPLTAEMSIGSVPAGTCADGVLQLLPIKEGPHWLKRIMVMDRCTGHRFDLRRVLQIHVQEKGVSPPP